VHVLFLQLAAPSYEYEDYRSNVPLAAGNLAAFANAGLRARGVTAEILERDWLDRAGDAAIVRAVLDRNPDVLAATLYCWNSHRTLDILERVRRVRPGILTIVGGAEVDRGNDFLMQYAGRAFDLAASGEGEELFIEVLERHFDRAPMEGIAGLGVAAGGAVEWAAPRAPVSDLSTIPSPYVTELFPLPAGGIQHIETARGCVFECDFCFYHADFRKVRLFPGERVAAEIRFALDRGVRDIYLMDPTFNGHAGYRETLAVLRPALHDHNAVVHTELRAEPMNGKNSGELYNSGIRSVEVGLQTVTPAALDAVGRTLDRARFATGCRALLDAGIGVEIGTIVGLPHDTPAGMVQTFEYARKECGDGADTVPFVLSLLPATVLRERAAQFGIEYSKYPPYTLLASPTFDGEGIRRTLENYTDIFGMELDAITPVRIAEYGGTESASLQPGDLLRRIAVDLRRASAEELGRAARDLSDRVESNCCVMFRGFGDAFAADVSKMLAFLRPLREANRHGLLEIVLDEPPVGGAVEFACAIRASLPPIAGHYLNEHLRYAAPEGADMTLRITAVLPVDCYESGGRPVAQGLPVLWKCTIDAALLGDAGRFEALLAGPFDLATLAIERCDTQAAQVHAAFGDDAQDLRFASAALQRELDALSGRPAAPPETFAMLGEGARVVAVRRGL
jgi:radical SAM superfamily enzyme YgiQ (UPF0313 family)